MLSEPRGVNAKYATMQRWNGRMGIGHLIKLSELW